MSTSDRKSSDHFSVMLEEAINGLHIQPDGFYVDATFGRGGHAAKILEQLSPEGRLLLLDRDPTAVAVAREKYQDDARVTIVHRPFSALQEVLQQLEIHSKIDGLLLDLGVSSPQLDQSERGFSFMNDGPLDMRMNPQQGVSAAEWLQQADQQEIARVLWEYGDERHSRRIARAIVNDRVETPFSSTTQLAELIKRVVPGHSKKHPATKSFQAIRIEVNQELQELRQMLDQLVDLLQAGGRIAIISFHSLEDRMVKRFFRRCEKGEQDFLPDIPLRSVEYQGEMKTVGKAQFPSAQEIEQNPRSRSAVLRVAEKRA
ncbi:MAG: 16S rRNA (cytosine(1402)-N(4))-methyltransferase RsmH [Gammaproteobacteria bacterium]|nr:16S rRNA (cytosine(1402)-N(4))-methyltransferase RsmH [Gammaproteobacteria bacterium]